MNYSNFQVSIPRGAVKRESALKASIDKLLFQFQEVQLKVKGDFVTLIIQIGFNSKRCS